MCNATCRQFVATHLVDAEIRGKDVLESGARDVNGSVRPSIEAFEPKLYIGTDIQEGPRVDQLVDAVNLINVFGAESFDVVVSTEMVEHTEDWRTIFNNFKQLLRPGGVVYVTTRSKGFGYHGYPYDFWRYEVADMQAIFADFINVVVEPDPFEPGVFVKAQKPLDSWTPVDLSTINLYAITLNG